MKWVYDGKVEGETGNIAGGDPQVGGPFFVTVWAPDKHVLDYAGTIDKIENDTIYFS